MIKDMRSYFTELQRKNKSKKFIDDVRNGFFPEQKDDLKIFNSGEGEFFDFKNEDEFLQLEDNIDIEENIIDEEFKNLEDEDLF